jgi:hypothetical protein
VRAIELELPGLSAYNQQQPSFRWPISDISQFHTAVFLGCDNDRLTSLFCLTQMIQSELSTWLIFCRAGELTGGEEMLENVQLIQEDGQAKFAVIPFAAFEEIRALLADEEKLADYLDYLHMQKVKEQNLPRLKLAEAKAALDID